MTGPGTWSSEPELRKLCSGRCGFAVGRFSGLILLLALEIRSQRSEIGGQTEKKPALSVLSAKSAVKCVYRVSAVRNQCQFVEFVSNPLFGCGSDAPCQ